MAIKAYMSPASTVAKGGGKAVLAHGLGADPTFVNAAPVKVAVGPVNIAVAHDATNVTVTNNDAASDIDVIVTALVPADVADEATALLNTAHRTDAAGTSHTALVAQANASAGVTTALIKNATERCILRNVPTGQLAVREGQFATGSIAASGTFTRSLAQLQAAFPGIDFVNCITEFFSDNNLVVVALTGVDITGGITCTNLDTVNAQQAAVRVRELHSIIQ